MCSIQSLFGQSSTFFILHCILFQAIDEYYQQDQTSALSLVQMKIPAWGNLTTLELALLGSDIAFISTKCCQAIIDKCWQNLRL